MDLKTYIESKPRGTASKLAHELGISPSYLSQLASGDAPISPRRAVEIEQKTEGEVTRRELFPEDWNAIWPELVDQ
jgi:DNA-binding transcriptional regulator YdaS (Cro superfamily)